MSRSLLLDAFPDAEIDYPDTDGKPMAETDVQRDDLTYAVESLRLYFRDRPDVYVSGNLLIYYVEGDPRASVAPDCFVVFGVPAHDRPIYKIWEEDGSVPAFVLEITSKSTRAEDCGTKRGLYAYLGVREYWQKVSPQGSRSAYSSSSMQQSGSGQVWPTDIPRCVALGC